jgi:hypothetical protein
MLRSVHEFIGILKGVKVATKSDFEAQRYVASFKKVYYENSYHFYAT